MREHRTDGARRLRQAGSWLGVGAAGTAFGVPVAIASVGTTKGARRRRGCCSGAGLAGWGLGIWRLVQAFRTREQCFDIHERGFTHRVAGTATVIPWKDVTQVSTTSGDDRPLADARGMGSTCENRLRSGRRIRVDTFTEDIQGLATVVHRAVHLGQFPQGRGVSNHPRIY
ncbi:hypothetical protein [Streptomyces sp. SID12501]|uniref:hypothetical protein n=1 Tax=Streptomyces sp. SID12501 TaxID=2706042 RepID=UPI001EF3392E|nr:hypothetical protein [Streptomyces sp. SID12501]